MPEPWLSRDWGGCVFGYLWPGGYLWGPFVPDVLGYYIGTIVGRAIHDAIMRAGGR